MLALDDAFGLNPAMTGLHRLYGEKRLAIVRGVGYPKPDRSHFRSMDIWQTGQPDRPGTTGRLGRRLDAAGGDPRLAVSFEPVLPPLLAGARSAGAPPAPGAPLPRWRPSSPWSPDVWRPARRPGRTRSPGRVRSACGREDRAGVAAGQLDRQLTAFADRMARTAAGKDVVIAV